MSWQWESFYLGPPITSICLSKFTHIPPSYIYIYIYIYIKSAGWLIVGISQIARESILFLLALDQEDYFASEVERHT